LTSCARLRGSGFSGVEEYPTSLYGIAQRIIKEEGMMRFYRGYTAYMLAIIFWMSALPAAGNVVNDIIPNLTDILSGK